MSQAYTVFLPQLKPDSDPEFQIMGRKVEMGIAAINKLAIDDCGPRPECLICVLFLIIEGTVIGRNKQAGCESIIQEHRAAIW